MTAPGLIDFFVLEASEYLEQLDGLLAGGANAPELDGFLRSARGLRGSATMARVVPFAELAGALERVGRAIRDGALPWDRAVGGALVSAVDDLKVLLHAARTWSDEETGKARARTMELLTMVPAGVPTPATPAAAGSGGVSFLSNETANVSAGLEFLVTAPGGGGDAGIQVLQRIRALRGIAAIKDVASLPDVLEGAEQASAPLEAGRPLTDSQREVLRHAATLLRELALAIRAGRSIPAEQVQAFDQSLDRWLDAEEGAGDPVVPIASLFHGDEGPHVVTATPNPPTTAAQRFRLEMVSNGEHLRLIVEEARSADPAGRERYRRHSRRALRAIRRSAESFGEQAVADALEAISAQVTAVDDAALARLALVARRLASPFADPQQLASVLRDAATDDPSRLTPVLPMAAVPAPPAAPAAAAPAPVAPAPVAPAPTVSAPVPGPPSPARLSVPDVVLPTPDRSAAALLERGAAAFGSIGSRPLLEPATLADAPIVPIGTLVYRGKSALRRALELRDEMREAGTPPEAAAVEELFDLIELALVD